MSESLNQAIRVLTSSKLCKFITLQMSEYFSITNPTTSMLADLGLNNILNAQIAAVIFCHPLLYLD